MVKYQAREMPYTSISRTDEVREAFESLKTAIQSVSDEEKTTPRGAHDFGHEESDLLVSFGDFEDLRRYLIRFLENESQKTVFEANPPKSGTDGKLGEGLFVADERGSRYLVRTGNLTVPGNHPVQNNIRQAFQQFTGPRSVRRRNR